MGFAVIEGDGKNSPIEIDCGLEGLHRPADGEKKEKYQQYRLRLLDYWSLQAPVMLSTYVPDVVVNEVVPPVIGAAFSSNGIQGQLAAAAITAVQTIAFSLGFPVAQIASQTVKTAIGGSPKATKTQVRNGVYQLLPSTERFKKEWVKIKDVSDACAVGLTHHGYLVK